MSEQIVLQRFNDQYGGFLQRFKNVISAVNAARGATEALQHIQEGDVIQNQVAGLFKKLDQEKRHLDNAAKASLDRKKIQTQREWDGFKQQYTQSKARWSTSQLNDQQRGELRDQRGKLLHARHITDETSNSLSNTQAAIQESIVIGIDTNEQLDQQTDQLMRMNDSVTTTNNTLDKSKHLLGRMRRRILTNKCTQGIIIVLQIIIILCIIFIKYYA